MDASANSDAGNQPLDDKNSQSMPLLQANGSKESTDVNILSNNALVPFVSPISGTPDETLDGDSYSDQISVYVVRKGDSISQIADMFKVSVNTILAANDMKKGDRLSEGQILLILPISGIEHTVVKGQTLKSIAKFYKVDIVDIVRYNDISEDEQLAVGDKLMIPNDTMADEGGDKPAPNLGSSIFRDKRYYEVHPYIKNLMDYFINPVPTGRKTQGLHGPGFRGIDIGAPTGTPIYASAPGVVLVTKTGCKVGYKRCGGGYGNMTLIEHPNSTRTLYGHMSKLVSRSGDQVYQGQIIGYVGNTGRSTGPHIHFEVFNARNPGADWSWKN